MKLPLLLTSLTKEEDITKQQNKATLCRSDQFDFSYYNFMILIKILFWF